MSGHDLSVLDELLADESMHDVTTFPDKPGTRAIFEALLKSFPDINVTVQQTIAEDNVAAIRWRATGTDTGGFRDFPPTGRSATWTGVDIFTFECGRIVNIQSQADGLARMHQVGLLPELDALMIATPEPADLASPAADCPPATVEETRAVAARWFADAVSPRDLDALGEFVAPNATLHATALPDSVGPEGISDQFRAVFDGFSDLQFAVEPGPAEGDLVLERWTATGTHDGEWLGIAPTGQEASWTGVNIYRLACDQIVEVWTEADALGLLQQLGIVEIAAPAAATPES